MSNTLSWCINKAILIPTLVAGLVYNVDGALNVGVFMIWFGAVLSPLLVNDTAARMYAEDPLRAPSAVVAVTWAFIAGLLVWYGYMWTAVAGIVSAILVEASRKRGENLVGEKV